MIQVQDTFICHPGNASKLAKLFKEWADFLKTEGHTATVLTDMTGQFHRVIIVGTYKDLTAYEEIIRNMGKSAKEKKMMQKFSKMNEMYHSGSREIYKVW